MEKEKRNSYFKKLSSFFAVALLLLLLANLLAISNIFIPKEEVRAGTVAEKTIKSPKNIYFKSKIKTKEAQDRAAAKVEKVYKFDSDILNQQKNKALEYFKKIDEAKSSSNPDKEGLITNIANLDLSTESVSYIANLKDEDWQSYKTKFLNLLDELEGKERIKNDEKIPQDLLEGEISKFFSALDYLSAAELANAFVIPNYIFSKEETDKAVEAVKADVEPVSLLLAQDEVIVRQGEIINDLSLEKLEAAGLKKASLFDPKTIGTIIISTILAFLIIFYFWYFYNYSGSSSISSLKALSIFTVFFLVTILAFQILTPLKPIMAYIIPVAAPVMLLSILVSSEVAIFSAIIFSVFLGIISTSSLELSVIYLVTSLVGIYLLKNVKKIEDIFRAGFFLAFFNFSTAVSFQLLTGSISLRTISVLLGAASIYGLGAVVLIIGTLLFWGNLFKVTTILELLELENPSQDLLKELSLKAPGTYHHSILVSNLAERAAGDIKADSLLVRVGALYHDIGKTLNPLYFIENQKRFDIHKKLKDPQKSAEIIKAHVKDGYDLGKKKNLPREILHFIESHHGTSEVFYFLSKAKEAKIKIDLSKFSYDGPLPQTKEAAILMLADSIEAKVRASEELSEKNIEEMISGIIDLKLKSNQLSDSDLSLKDLKTLKQSFINTLKSMYHKRIEYPDEKS